jgi:hypothetical protein
VHSDQTEEILEIFSRALKEDGICIAKQCLFKHRAHVIHDDYHAISRMATIENVARAD